MDEHTPGPWNVDDNEGYGATMIHGDQKLLAQIVGDSAEAEANARLIAAAPDMLAMLRRAEFILDDLDGARAFHSDVRTLIAKATGDREDARRAESLVVPDFLRAPRRNDVR